MGIFSRVGRTVAQVSGPKPMHTILNVKFIHMSAPATQELGSAGSARTPALPSRVSSYHSGSHHHHHHVPPLERKAQTFESPHTLAHTDTQTLNSGAQAICRDCADHGRTDRSEHLQTVLRRATEEKTWLHRPAREQPLLNSDAIEDQLRGCQIVCIPVGRQSSQQIPVGRQLTAAWHQHWHVRTYNVIAAHWAFTARGYRHHPDWVPSLEEASQSCSGTGSRRDRVAARGVPVALPSACDLICLPAHRLQCWHRRTDLVVLFCSILKRLAMTCAGKSSLKRSRQPISLVELFQQVGLMSGVEIVRCAS
jgi:hypothetical protein